MNNTKHSLESQKMHQKTMKTSTRVETINLEGDLKLNNSFIDKFSIN